MGWEYTYAITQRLGDSLKERLISQFVVIALVSVTTARRSRDRGHLHSDPPVHSTILWRWGKVRIVDGDSITSACVVRAGESHRDSSYVHIMLRGIYCPNSSAVRASSEAGERVGKQDFL
jgi:hypothetical protein